MTAILKLNCPSIRKRLRDAGIELCICCEFDGAVWLTASIGGEKVHGEGYPIEELDIFNVEDVLSFEFESEKYIDYDCNVEGFIKFCKESLNKN